MHTHQAPESTWNIWRDHNFIQHLRSWRVMIDFWSTRFEDENKCLIVLYEDLIDVERGPAVASAIMTFLGEGVVPYESIPCAWHKVVHGSAERIHRPHKYTPSYSRKQLLQITENLTQLSHAYSNNSAISRAISLYLETAENRLSLV
mmetsp:Transcript_7810/g.16947  ORF Transcript_7810/g.16947 Transcript_7810/m.16947 type:complete len:147 (+) Transcript_7810:663-1103(+)